MIGILKRLGSCRPARNDVPEYHYPDFTVRPLEPYRLDREMQAIGALLAQVAELADALG